MSDKLKPCPFCGSEEILFLISGHFKPWSGDGMSLWYKCACYECGTQIDNGEARTMKEAARKWNTRAGEQE